MVGRAIAIEAEPYNFDLMRRNVALNGLESVVACVHCAVSESEGFAEIQMNVGDNLGDHRIASVSTGQSEEQPQGVVRVPTRRLDDVIREHNGGQIPGPRQCLIWMDIQAHEAFALKGAPDLMASGNPLCIEVWPWGLERSGGGARPFIDLVSQHWTEFVHFGHAGEVRRSINELAGFIEKEIGYGEGQYDNILLIRG